METYRIVLADDHVIFRQGMKHLIATDPGFKIVAEAGTGSELIEILDELQVDLAVLDISMPGACGIDTLQSIRKEFPQVKVLILTMHKQREFLFHAISAGADGYLLKEDSDEEFFSAIEAIRNGGIYITKHLRREVPLCSNNKEANREMLSVKRLTRREKEVVKMVTEGIQNREIANLLNISIRTVENHRANIMRKLRLKTLAELVRYAIQMGISELPV